MCGACSRWGGASSARSKLLNWVLIVCHPGRLSAPGRALRARRNVVGGGGRTRGLRRGARHVQLPSARSMDFFLLGALVAYSGCRRRRQPHLVELGARQGLRHGGAAGYIPAAIGGQKVNLAHSGFIFAPEREAMRRWRGWWRIVRADQWGVFFTGAILGMVLPALLYVTFIPRGSDIQGLGISAALASSVGRARRARCSPGSLHSSARGSCSRHSSTTSKGWCAPLPTSSGPAAPACAHGAVATCARCTTACWPSSSCGASWRCGWHSRSSC